MGSVMLGEPRTMDTLAAASSIDAAYEPLPPIDLSHHYSNITKNRNASSVKGFYKYFKIPHIGNLAGGQSQHAPLKGWIRC